MFRELRSSRAMSIIKFRPAKIRTGALPTLPHALRLCEQLKVWQEVNERRRFVLCHFGNMFVQRHGLHQLFAVRSA